MPPKGVPVEHPEAGVAYYFPRTGVTLTRRFDAEMTAERNSTDAYYRQRAAVLLKQSGYFLEISPQQRACMVHMKYRQSVYTPMTEELLSLLSPFNALFGPTLEMGLDLDIEVRDRRKVIERYHYQKRFEAKRGDVKKIAAAFFDSSVKEWLETMAKQSRLQRIAVKPGLDEK